LNKKLLLILMAFCVLAIAATGASATTFRTEKFALQGNGSFMASPPLFAGDIIFGTLFPGTFWLKFDDAGWPADDPGTPENEAQFCPDDAVRRDQMAVFLSRAFGLL
jgi:hypothetical protein